MQQEATHGPKSDSVHTLMANIVYDKVIAKNNPLFNKTQLKYLDTRYQHKDLVAINQITKKQEQDEIDQNKDLIDIERQRLIDLSDAVNPKRQLVHKYQ